MKEPQAEPQAEPLVAEAAIPKRRRKPSKPRQAAPAVYAQMFVTADEVERIDRVAQAKHLKRISWVKEVCRRALGAESDYLGDALGSTAPRAPEDNWQRIRWHLAGNHAKTLERLRGKVPSTSYLRAVVMHALLDAEANE